MNTSYLKLAGLVAVGLLVGVAIKGYVDSHSTAIAATA